MHAYQTQQGLDPAQAKTLRQLKSWLPWKRTEACQLLDGIRDTAAIGALLEAREYLAHNIWFRDRDILEAVETALVRLLPRMSALQATRLAEPQRHCLYNALRSRNADLTLALLTLFKTWATLEPECSHAFGLDSLLLERWAAGQGRGAGDPRLRQVAQGCLPLLQVESSALSGSERSLLLRPSNAPCVPMALRRYNTPDTQKPSVSGC